MERCAAVAKVARVVRVRMGRRLWWVISAFSFGALGGAGVAMLREPPVSILIESFERRSPTWVSEDDGEGALFSVEVPRVTGGCGADAEAALNGALMRLVEMPLEGYGARSLEVQASSLLGKWRACRVDNPTGACVARWWTRREAQVLHNSGGLLSVQIAERWYSGGAHSNYRTHVATFDVSTGRRVDVRDLLGAVDRSRVAEAVAQGVVKGGVPCVYEDLVQRAALTDNVAVVEGGLLFSFDPYEVSGFAQGTIQQVIPWTAAAGLDT